MSTRMTNDRRSQISHKIYKATSLPGRLEENEKQIVKLIANWYKALVPKDFVEATKSLPKEWFQHTATIHCQAGTNPYSPDINSNSEWSSIISLDDPIKVPVSMERCKFTRDDAKRMPHLLELLAERVDLFKQEKAVKENLRLTLNAYNTVEKLIKDFPEFEKHCDVPAKEYPIAVNTAATSLLLMKAGFDVTVQKPKAKSTKSSTKTKKTV